MLVAQLGAVEHPKGFEVAWGFAHESQVGMLLGRVMMIDVTVIVMQKTGERASALLELG